jgi:hypothetical protein
MKFSPGSSRSEKAFRKEASLRYLNQRAMNNLTQIEANSSTRKEPLSRLLLTTLKATKMGDLTLCSSMGWSKITQKR